MESEAENKARIQAMLLKIKMCLRQTRTESYTYAEANYDSWKI